MADIHRLVRGLEDLLPELPDPFAVRADLSNRSPSTAPPRLNCVILRLNGVARDIPDPAVTDLRSGGPSARDSTGVRRSTAAQQQFPVPRPPVIFARPCLVSPLEAPIHESDDKIGTATKPTQLPTSHCHFMP